MTNLELGQRENTELTEDAQRDEFLRSFNNGDRQWLEEVDLGGTNNITTMSQLAIAKRMRAHTASRVKAARERIANKKHEGDDDKDSEKSKGKASNRKKRSSDEMNNMGRKGDRRCMR